MQIVLCATDIRKTIHFKNDTKKMNVNTVKRTGLFQLSLDTSVAIRKHNIKTSMYFVLGHTLLTSMRTFDDKQGDSE